MEEKVLRKVKEGQVVSNKMDKSVVVAITTKVKDKDYGKYIKRTKKYMAHDEENSCRIGDLVRIEETRPLSKNKCWKVTDIVTRAVE